MESHSTTQGGCELVSQVSPNLASRATLTLAQAERFVDGMARVVKPIERNANYDEILGKRLPVFFRKNGFDIDELPLSAADVLAVLDRSMYNKRTAIQMVPPGAAVGWGKTRNNLREFDFLRRLLQRHQLDSKLFNLSYHRTKVGQLMHGVSNVPMLRDLFNDFVSEQWPLSPAAVFQLINYVQSHVSWQVTFQSTPALPRVLVVANDHSPNQVACTVVARDLGIPTIYIQHAEVTSAFPPLIFDVSILRNHASLEVYEQVGPIKGAAHVVSRDETPFNIDGFSQATQADVEVGVYLTAQVLWDGVRQVIKSLRDNPRVASVFIKPHPSQAISVLAAEVPGVEVRLDFSHQPHVAVVANSSVVVELLHNGNVVLQNYAMDAVPADYYGFSAKGIAAEVSIDQLSRDFWQDFVADEDWRRAFSQYDPWALDEYLENEKQLALALAEYFPAQRSDDLAATLRQAQPVADAPALGRRLLQSVPNTVIDYINEPERFAPARWSDSVASLDFSGAMQAIFADRVTNSYEVFGTTRRVAKVSSELVYASKRRDIELTGRRTEAAELDEMTAYIASLDVGPTVRWTYYIEYLMFLLRLGEEERIHSLFASLPEMPVRRLGINRRIAVVKWLRNNPRAQLAMRMVPARLYDGLTPFQKLKLMVLSATPEMYDKRPWSHQQIETWFLETASPGARAELQDIFVQCYDGVREQMQFMEVRWSQPQREAFYTQVETALRNLRAFSLVRLSDREAYMFANGNGYFTQADVENCERHWWRMELPLAQRAKLTALMRQAAQRADVLGIPSIYRLLRESDSKTKTFLGSLQGRGLAEVALQVSQRALDHQLLSEEKCNVALFSDLSTVLRLCAAAKRTVLVASANEDEVQRLFQSVKQMKYIAIPTHSRTMSNQKYATSSKALPQVYGELRQRIAATVLPGDLVLVAAGVIGKIFVEDAKEAGGVGLDVGTCLDDWVGAGIHSLH